MGYLDIRPRNEGSMTTKPHIHTYIYPGFDTPTSTAGDPPHVHIFTKGEPFTEPADGHRHSITWMENGEYSCSLPLEIPEPDLYVHTHEDHVGTYTTGQLLDELEARNVGGQRARFEKTMEQADRHIQKLRRAFSIRDGGLGYRTVD